MSKWGLSRRGSVSIEAMLVFTAVAVFWVFVFRSISPYLEETREKALESELKGECGRLAGLVDSLSTYGKGVYVDYAPFAGSGVFFCQEGGFCSSNEIFAVRLLGSGEVRKASCRTRVAEWVNVRHGGEVLSCEKAISGGVHSINVTFATYDEKTGEKRVCE